MPGDDEDPPTPKFTVPPAGDGTTFVDPQQLVGGNPPAERVAERTAVSALQMYRALKDGWGPALGATQTPPRRESLLVLLSQWALETGRGAAMMNYNIAGIKSIPGDGHDFTFYATTEVMSIPAAHQAVVAGLAGIQWEHEAQNLASVLFHPRHPATRFRAYSTLAAAVPDYLHLLQHRFSKSWLAVESGDPKMFAHLLRMQGYYTAAESDYANGLTARYQEFSHISDDPDAPDLESTRGVKKALTLLGYDVGLVDDTWDPKAQEALKDFQSAHGIGVDGVPGPESRRQLSKALSLT